MSRKIHIPVRSLGSETGDPTIPALAAWVGSHHGVEADLVTYKLDTSIRLQEEITTPAAGGRFYLPRLQASLVGIRDHLLVQEASIDTREGIHDAEWIVAQRKGTWCSLPSPQLWEITDQYYHDPGEFLAALCHCTRQWMRVMRDRGVRGHVLLCDQYREEEIIELAGRRVLLFAEEVTLESLSLLLEHQKHIAIPSDRVQIALGLLDQYDISHLTLVDPTPASLREVQTHLDPDSFESGGYCRAECESYWKMITESSFIMR